MINVTDQYYIQQVKAGNIRAFASIVNKYQGMIVTIIMKIIENREDAEDIAQEVFIKVFKSLDSFKEESEFSTWLYRIAYNTTLSELRKRKLFFTSMDGDYQIVCESVIDNNENKTKEEQLILLDKALKQLPADETFLITLYYLDQQSIENISQIAALSASNVKVKLHRIRKKLAVIMNKMKEE